MLLQRPQQRSKPCVLPKYTICDSDGYHRVLFPGALNSEFTDSLEFLRPSTNKAISTFRVLDQYGHVLDKDIGVDTTDEEAVELYKHMVRCTASSRGS